MNSGSKLTQEVITKLATEYQAGKTTPELASEFGLSKATVCRGLRKAGIEPMRKDGKFAEKPLTPDIESAIKTDFKDGLSIPQLTTKYELTIYKVNEILRSALNAAPKVLTKQPLTDLDHQEMCRKFVEEPYTKQALAEEYSIHVDVVSAILRKNGITVTKYIPTDVVDEICDDYSGGMDVTDLVRTYQYGPDAIQYWLFKRGLSDTINTVSIIGPELSPEAIRKVARREGLSMMEILVDIAKDHSINPRTRADAAKIVVERGYGRPGDEATEENQKETSTAKIMKLISNNSGSIFNKKNEG